MSAAGKMQTNLYRGDGTSRASKTAQTPATAVRQKNQLSAVLGRYSCIREKLQKYSFPKGRLQDTTGGKRKKKNKLVTVEMAR